MKYLGLIIFTLVLFSCNNNVKNHNYCRKTLEETLKTNISDNFRIIEYNTTFAIGDYNERFKIKLTEKEFNNIFESLESDMKKVKSKNLYYINIHNNKGDFISIIFNPLEFTIQYSYNSE